MQNVYMTFGFKRIPRLDKEVEPSTFCNKNWIKIRKLLGLTDISDAIWNSLVQRSNPKLAPHF